MALPFFPALFLIFLALSPAVAVASSHFQTLLRTTPEDLAIGTGRGDAGELYCDSWRLSVETNNAGSWSMIPESCAGFVKEYMNGDRYASDSDVIAGESLAFAQTAPIADDGKDVWIFDVDETLLSNLPYYASHGYGREVFNETSFDKWVDQANAPALPASLKLYNELLGLGYQIVLLTGRNEAQRKVTEDNLLSAGYHSWEKLILRQESDMGKIATLYKSERRTELEAQGFRILGSSGDQWSDLLGSPMAKRSFKLPNPMYYID